MDTVKEYPDHPLTTTRMIAWDTPSNWGFSSPSPQSSTTQPLTANNLSAYVDSQFSTFADPKNDIMTRYYSSMKNNHPENLRSSSKSNNSNKYYTQSSSATSTPTKNVAIDAHPLPFPYHNDCTFLPTVETGRTRFDSESTQSLYDSQPSSPTLSAFSSSKRHTHSAGRGGGPSPNLSPSRNIPGYQRYRRGSNISYYSTVTTATGTTSGTGVTQGSKAEHHYSNATQQQRRRPSFKATKRQLNTFISNNRYIPSGAQRRLSLLLVDEKENMTVPTGVKKQHTSLGQQQPHYLNNASKMAIYGHTSSSSPSISTAALYNYYQGSSSPSQQHHLAAATPNMPDSLSTTQSSSPPPSPVTTYTYTTDSDMPTVISSSTFPRESAVWQNQLVYMASPSDQYHRRYNKPTPCLPESQSKDGFFARFAKKLWPFRHV